MTKVEDTELVTLELTEEQYSTISEAAKLKNLSIEDYISEIIALEVKEYDANPTAYISKMKEIMKLDA